LTSAAQAGCRRSRSRPRRTPGRRQDNGSAGPRLQPVAELEHRGAGESQGDRADLTPAGVLAKEEDRQQDGDRRGLAHHRRADGPGRQLHAVEHQDRKPEHAEHGGGGDQCPNRAPPELATTSRQTENPSMIALHQAEGGWPATSIWPHIPRSVRRSASSAWVTPFKNACCKHYRKCETACRSNRCHRSSGG
jgi:hypothetical protein